MDLVNSTQRSDGLELRASAASDTGKVRRLNEDSFLVADGAFVVADGMGGHKAGDVASRLTIEAIEQWLSEGIPDVSGVASVVARANQAVRDHAGESGREGMGSTLVGAFVVRNADEQSVVIVNVGDSRCYALNDGVLVQITKDHSHVQELVDAGMISAQEADTHPERNVVTRAIGIEPAVAGDFYVLPPVPQVRLLLCSDGVSGEVPFDEIRSILSANPDGDVAVAALIDAVLEGRAGDNATAIVLDVVRDPRVVQVEPENDLDVTGPRVRFEEVPVDRDVAAADDPADVITTVPAARAAAFPPPTVPVIVIDEVPR